MTRRLAATLALAGAAAAVATVSAQEVSVAAARHLGRPWRTQWTMTYSPWAAGPLDAGVSATLVDGDDGQRHALGLELAVFRRGASAFYLLGGAFVGVGRRGAGTVAAGWSAGAGYRLVRLEPFHLTAEARYHEITQSANGVSLGLRLGVRFGAARSRMGGRQPPADAVEREPAPPPVTISPESRTAAIIGTALDVMGTPYLWGGSDANGFDCSGLIQYAYARHGIPLPRRSVEQAVEGLEVGRDPFALRPGDILTFALGTGDQVTHVGLYLGDGRFVHSGSQGVTISTLRPTDPVGKYWWDRWIGARRIIK